MFKIHFEVSNQIVINKAVEEVFAFVIDFKTWNRWSPWSVIDTKITQSVSGAGVGEVGHQMNWDGELTGSGYMKISEIQKSSQLNLQLEFLTPWKASNTAQFRFHKISMKETKVEWTMQTSIPFFIFFMKKEIQAYLTRDFGRGLLMLKELVETGDLVAKTQFEGINEKPEFHFVGISRQIDIKDISSFMSKDFETLKSALDKGQLEKPDFVFSFTDEWDLINQKCRYRACFGYYSKPQKALPSNFVSGDIPAHKAICVKHLGKYAHLGNSWGLAVSYQRSKRYKLNKKVSMYEVYHTMPGQGDERDLHTEVNVPVN